MRFNQILIVDSIPAGERNTARNLHADVSLRAHAFGDAPAVNLLRVESRNEFMALLDMLAAAVEMHGHIPILHIECHGSQEGLQFADGSQCGWSELKPSLIALNVATQLNLLVIVSACDGNAIATAVGVVERAPLWGFIGPTRKIRPEELEVSFLAFYEELLRTRSASGAMVVLRASASPGTYMFMTAEAMFQLIWDHYQEVHESSEALQERAQRLHELMADWPKGRRRSVEEIVQMFRDHNPGFFDVFRSLFFMLDLFPENVDRFNVRYEAPNN